IVEKKVAGEEIEVAPEAAPAKVVDLMEALKASVVAAKKKTPAPKPKAAAKKPAAKKTAAKRAAAPRKKAAAG
ncbi:MAG: Ku protein, partial [Actinomycetota bacterium]